MYTRTLAYMEKQSITNTSSSSWIRGSFVGRGCFGTVSKAVSKSDGGVFAVKSVDFSTCLPAQAASLENEIAILRSLKSHPHIVRFLGDDVTKEGTKLFRNLHLEYLPEGDVANGGIVDETLLRRYLWCLVSALRHVHANGIVHCDVKSKNVIIANGGSSVKLADFGSAIELEKPMLGIAPRGSPLWMAPEVIRREYQGPESDVWSLGCTVIEMLTGKPAWEDHGFESLSRIGFSNELPSIPKGISELCRDFLYNCLKRDRTQRWNCDLLLQHPFLCHDHYSFLTESSPRCVLDWVNSDFDEESDGLRLESMVSAMARIGKLARNGGAIWESNGWIEVRGDASEMSGVEWEYLNSTRQNSELKASSEPSGDPVGQLGNTEAATASASRCESLLLVVENIQINAMFYTSITIIRILYCCCYHYQYNTKNKKNKRLRKIYLLFLALTFCLVLHVIPIGLSIISRKLLRGVVLTLNCCLLFLITLIYFGPNSYWFGSNYWFKFWIFYIYVSLRVLCNGSTNNWDAGLCNCLFNLIVNSLTKRNSHKVWSLKKEKIW